MKLSTKMFAAVFFVFGLTVSTAGFSQQGLLAMNNRINEKTTTMKTNEGKNEFSIFPNSVKKSAKILVEASTDGWATFQVRGACGEILLEQQMVVSKGSNSIPIFFISEVEKGTYDAELRIEDKVFFSRLVKE